MAIDTVPRGYRIAARPGAVTRRPRFFDEDMDALEEAWETRACVAVAAVKVQAPGQSHWSRG